MGVWIETINVSVLSLCACVTPFVGVWIETCSQDTGDVIIEESHPSWVCGLKLSLKVSPVPVYSVTPFVGVWIETQPLVA